MARNFNGSTDYISLGTPAALDITANLTILSWVNTSSPTTVQRIVWTANSNSGHVVYDLNISDTTSAKGTVRRHENSGAEKRANTTTSVSTSTWTALTASMNGNIEIFFNGTSEDTIAYDGGTKAGTAQATQIGRYLFSTFHGSYFTGQISMVLIYDTDIPATHHKAFSNGVNPFALIHDNMQLFCPLDGNDSPELEYGPNSITPTLSGTSKGSSNPPVELLENYL